MCPGGSKTYTTPQTGGYNLTTKEEVKKSRLSIGDTQGSPKDSSSGPSGSSPDLGSVSLGGLGFGDGGVDWAGGSDATGWG